MPKAQFHAAISAAIKRAETPDWAHRLKQAREMTGKNSTQFAKDAGLSQPRYSQYETGKREPDAEAWRKIMVRLPVSLDFIILGRVTIGNETKN